jgi:hypothetical protein
MPTIQRSTLLVGGGKITHGAYSFLHLQPFNIRLTLDRMQIAPQTIGLLDERMLDVDAKLAVQPDGAWTAAARAALWPYASTRPGASIFAGDTDLVINCLTDERYTAKAAAITKMPDILLSASKSMIGQAEYTLLGQDNTAWTGADRFFAIDNIAYTDPALTVATIRTQPYTGVWGAVPGFNSIETEDGWTITFDLGLAPANSDSYGRLDWRMQSLQVRASCTPINISPTQIRDALYIQDAAAFVRGGSMQAKGNGLVITGADATVPVTIANCALVEGGFRFGSNVYRQDMISFLSTRTLAAGIPQPLFVLA